MKKRLAILVLALSFLCFGWLWANPIAEGTFRVIEISLDIGDDGAVRFYPAYAYEAGQAAISRGSNEYILRAVDGNGTLLSWASSDPVEEETVTKFNFILPFPDATARFEFISAEEIMAQLDVSPHIPEAAFDEQAYRTEEPLRLSWSWSDADDDMLYADLYLIYGSNVELLAYDLEDNYLDIDFSQLVAPEGGEAFFYLSVSDGVNTFDVISDIIAFPGEGTISTLTSQAVLDDGRFMPAAIPMPALPMEAGTELKSAATTTGNGAEPDVSTGTIVLTIDSLAVLMNDQLQEEPPLAPQILNGRTMLPFRYLVQNLLNGEVSYIAEEQRIVATVHEHTVDMVVDDVEILVDAQSFDFGQAPVVIEGHTLVPVKAFEQFLQSLIWDETNRTVTIIP